jgi:dTDP-glucose 4,6-dehydratase
VPNVEIARMVARAAGAGDDAVYLSAYDRPDHDRRYAVSVERIAGLGWAARHPLDQAIPETVAWYRDHADWWGTLVPEAERLYAD